MLISIDKSLTSVYCEYHNNVSLYQKKGLILMNLVINEKLNLIIGSYLKEITAWYRIQTEDYTEGQTDFQKKELADQYYNAAMSDVELYDLLHEEKHHLDLASAIAQMQEKRDVYTEYGTFGYLLDAIDQMEQAKLECAKAQAAFESQTGQAV